MFIADSLIVTASTHLLNRYPVDTVWAPGIGLKVFQAQPHHPSRQMPSAPDFPKRNLGYRELSHLAHTCLSVSSQPHALCCLPPPPDWTVLTKEGRMRRVTKVRRQEGKSGMASWGKCT